MCTRAFSGALPLPFRGRLGAHLKKKGLKCLYAWHTSDTSLLGMIIVGLYWNYHISDINFFFFAFCLNCCCLYRSVFFPRVCRLNICLGSVEEGLLWRLLSSLWPLNRCVDQTKLTSIAPANTVCNILLLMARSLGFLSFFSPGLPVELVTRADWLTDFTWIG